MENNNIICDSLTFDDSHVKHGLRGHVMITRVDKKTGEESLWYESDNIIPISGYQWILMKMFGLHLDSNHMVSYEDLGKDTTVVIPDLNNAGAYQIGINPNSYSVMDEDISSKHFVQGFMIGNGGSGEDAISSKNTDYSFVKLRNAIPFQQTSSSLASSIAGKYLGVLRSGSGSTTKSYYIKKFDERPNIVHSWWQNGQKWDYIDPITQNDLGPNAVNGTGKTNRIETYVECQMSISDSDCSSYFEHEGNSQTAAVNELGLVAFDSVMGKRSIIETMYNDQVKRILKIIFDNNRATSDAEKCVGLAGEIITIANENQITTYGESHINAFLNVMNDIRVARPESLNFGVLSATLTQTSNIEVSAAYNQSGVFMYETDKFLDYMASTSFDTMTTDEAQRIKLITYYTFNSIPLQKDWETKITYRIYAN